MSSIPVMASVYHDSYCIPNGENWTGSDGRLVSAQSPKRHAQDQRFQAQDWPGEAWNLACAGKLGKMLKYVILIKCEDWWNWLKWVEMELRGSHRFAWKNRGIDGNKNWRPGSLMAKKELVSANIPSHQPGENNLCVCVSNIINHPYHLSCIVSISWDHEVVTCSFTTTSTSMSCFVGQSHQPYDCCNNVCACHYH